jgi:Tfp pilus assembly protein FimT
MEKKERISESGVSILEVLLVLAVGAILIGVTVAQFGKSKLQLQRQNVARELKNYLERCRFDSVRRRVDDTDTANMAQVVIKSSTSYEIYIDLNQDGVISTAEKKTIDFSSRSEAKIIPASGTFPITIKFNRKGHITTDANGVAITSPLFTICNNGCTASTTITTANGNVISVSSTGTVAMLNGGESINPLTLPSITNVNSNANVNYLLSVIPITVVQTATMRECTMNEKPGSPATCQCSTPREVKPNKKCQ